MRKLSIFGIVAAGVLAGTGLVRALDSNSPTPDTQAPVAKNPTACSSMPHRPMPGMAMGGRPDWRGHMAMRGGDSHGGPLGQMLNLTDEQKAKVKALVEAQKPKYEEIRREEEAKMKALREELADQIRPLLTKEQQQVLTDMQNLEKSRSALRQQNN